MLIQQVMTPVPITVTPDDDLALVKRLFERHHFHHLLVVEQGRLVGILSDRDLLKAISPHIGTINETNRDLATLNKRVHQVMGHHPITIATHASLHDAVELLVQRNISCLPVLHDDQRIAGIVSWRDVLGTLDQLANQ